jgi:hypothetical protein
VIEQRGHTNMRTGKPIRPPRHIATVMDLVATADRAYFDEHPEATCYLRPYCPNEFWPKAFPAGSLVRVTYLGPGLRTREPILTVPGDPALN